MQQKGTKRRFGKNSGAGKRPQGSWPTHLAPKSNRSKRGQDVDISSFIKRSANIEAPKSFEIQNTFSDFDLCREIKGNIKKRGLNTPYPIQDRSINHILNGKDLIGLANTGTGKTAAFLLPLIDKVHRDRSQKVLIIAPTRELALQIENELRLFSWGMKIYFASCVGGLSIHKQIANLKRNPNFVIGTPGRLKDLSERRIIRFSSFNNVVIDEVDRMFDMGFIDEITAFLDQLPKQRQSLMFSATIPPKIKDLVESFLKDPVMVDVKYGETASNVDQSVIKVSRDAKFNHLQELLSQPELSRVIIFNDTKRAVEKLTVSLIKEGFKAESIHGDKTQGQRQRALASFKNQTVDILVATDVAARGLDIKEVSHVINYTTPQSYDDYIHRIGRTGRADCRGKAMTFVESY